MAVMSIKVEVVEDEIVVRDPSNDWRASYRHSTSRDEWLIAVQVVTDRAAGERAEQVSWQRHSQGERPGAEAGLERLRNLSSRRSLTVAQLTALKDAIARLEAH